MLLAHAGRTAGPEGLWQAWTADPLVIGGLLIAAVLYGRGYVRRRVTARARRHAIAFGAASITLAAAVLSPLDAAASALASAHMVQHLILLLVVCPLFAASRPAVPLLRGLPPALTRLAVRLRAPRRVTRVVADPYVAWSLHVAVIWLWHAALPYGAALEHRGVHILQHSTFVITGALFWRVVLGRPGRSGVSAGLGIMLVFGMALQSIFLSVLLTFAPSPWYEPYARTTHPWGLRPLADQQLAGVIMWVPGGMAYVAIALARLASWLRASEEDATQMPVSGRRQTTSDRRVPSPRPTLTKGSSDANVPTRRR